MFAMLRNSLLGLLVASAIAMALCALFLVASFIGFSMPRSVWAQGWLPVQVETDAPASSRRKITRFPSLERAVAKAGPGDTVTVLSSIDVTEPISVDNDLSVVIGQGCTVRSVVREGRPVFTVNAGCQNFSIDAGHASRIVFESPDAGGLLAVSRASLPANVALRGVSVHDVSPACGASLLDIGPRLVELSLVGCDVYNLSAPVIGAHTGAQANIAVVDSRFERIKGRTAIDLSASPASVLLVHDSVLIGSLGCDLIRMAHPNLLLSANSYLSALGANAVVCDCSAPAVNVGARDLLVQPRDFAFDESKNVANRVAV